MLLLALIACTCADTTAETPEPVVVPAVTLLPEAHRPLCATPLGCGLLVHHPIETFEASLCDWCGEERPSMCGPWLPSAPGADEPRCGIYRELERCVLQGAGVTRFGDLPDIARENVLRLQERADAKGDCVE